MKHRIILTSLVLTFTLIFSGCHVFKKGQTRTSSQIEDFDQFYQRFHKDSDFQMSRLYFPLQGKLIDGERIEDWTRNNWSILKVEIYDVDKSDFRVKYDRGADTFYQKFWTDEAEFYAEYRFELIGNKWFLVYAKDVNL
jgi:hypothetical protein